MRLLIVNDLEDKLHRTISFFEDDGIQFIGFRQEPLECPLGRILKRGLDVAVSLPVVIFVLPPICADDMDISSDPNRRVRCFSASFGLANTIAVF